MNLNLPSITTLAATLLLATAAKAQTDEIQVYTGDLAAPGEFTLVLHTNYTPEGIKTPAFPGAVVPHHTFNSVPEWAYGVTNWFEAGLYLPVFSAGNGQLVTDSMKLRALFAVPNADKRPFVYGVNFELSYNAKRWDERRVTGEIRPIVGWHSGPVDFFINPILDTSFQGGLGQLDFAPSVRLAYNFSDKWAWALEHYADFGPINHMFPTSAQSQQVFLVGDYGGKPGIEFGIGRGLNGATDKWVVKLMFEWSLNK